MKYLWVLMLFHPVVNAGTLTFEGSVTNPSSNIQIPVKFNIDTDVDCPPEPTVTVNGVEQDADATEDGVLIQLPNPEPNKKYMIQVEYK